MYVFGGTGTNTSGAYKTYGQLVALVNGQNAKSSKYHDLTTRFSSDETNYPYRAVVKDASNNYVHYGEWTVTPSLGTFGMFYWEKEEDGQNNGYKITYIGGSNGTLQYDSTLCTVHDDGGNIASYGYGYYVIEGEESSVELDTNSIDGLTFGSTYDSEVASALKEQIQGFTFYPYVSGHDVSNNISLKTGYSGTYGIVNLVYTNSKDSSKTQTLTYRIAPFFANSFSLVSNDFGETNEHLNNQPGVDIPFEIRSATQLQYINWNNSGNVNSLVDGSNYTKFNYLMYTKITGVGTQTKAGAGNSDRANITFKMSHDLNASKIINFTPIAGQNTSSSSGYNATLYAWFGSTFDGDSYKIQELNINSKSFTVGLFGVTVGSKLENIILYSTNGATIERETTYTDAAGAYSLGGLCGVAYDYSSSDNTLNIENCAIAGYKIVDNSKNKITLGEVNVGGLVGVSNISINKCSSVVDIIIKCTHKSSEKTNATFTQAEWGNFIRVGGLSGAVQYKVTNSYTGGSIKVEGDVLNETYNGSGARYSSYISTNSTNYASDRYSTHIYLSGIAGSGFTMNYQNFTNKTGITDGYPNIENCYTYINFPTLEGTIRAISMITTLADRYSGASNNAKITNCYYLENSANFGINAPSYYFSGNSNNSPSKLINSYKSKMITGDLTYIYQLFKKGETQYSKVTINNLKSVSYGELSDINDMTSKLGNAFNAVTTTDSQGQTVNGKYSFNAGNSELDGKDYPFPTVIKEDSNNVHYGVWPNNNAYFEYGTYTLDIFKNMKSLNKDSYAYMDLKLVKLANETFDTNSLNIHILNEVGTEDNNIAQIVNYDENNKYGIDADGNYLIKVQANNTGTVTVKATWTENGVSKSAISTLTVTANLNVMASPSSIDLENNQSSIYKIGKNTDSNYLMAYASNDEKTDYSSLCDWSYVSSKINDEDAVTLNGEKTRLTIISNGYSATVTATAKYNYHNVTFSSITSIDVGSYGGIGISDSTNYNEALVKDDDTDEVLGNDKSYSKELAPANESSTYFIYDRNIGLFNQIDLNNVNVDITKDGKKISGVTWSLDPVYTTTTINDENIFYSIPLNIIYRVSNFDDATLDNVLISATVTYNNVLYKVSLTTSIEATPYNLILDAGDGKFADSTSSKSIEIRETISLSDYVPTREGYEFAGWYYENGDEFKDDEVTVEGAYDIQKDNKQQDIKLYAHWTLMKSTINIDLNYDGLKYELPDIEYGSDSIDLTLLEDKLTRSGYILQGFYYIDGDNETLVLDKDGNVINSELLNSLIVAQKGGAISTLTAKWQKNSKVCFKTKDGSTTFGIVDYINGQGAYVPTLKDSYSIEGWYDENGNKVLNSDGSVVDEIVLVDEITVYARFKTTGYVVSSTMESGSTYVITSSNYAMTDNNDDTSVDASEFITTTDTSGNEYIPSSYINENTLWTYEDGSKIKNNNTNSYLAAYYYYYYGNYYLFLSSNSDYNSNWLFNGDSLYRIYNSRWGGNYTCYAYHNGSEFDSTNSVKTVVLYKLANDIVTDNYK